MEDGKEERKPLTVATQRLLRTGGGAALLAETFHPEACSERESPVEARRGGLQRGRRDK